MWTIGTILDGKSIRPIRDIQRLTSPLLLNVLPTPVVRVVTRVDCDLLINIGNKDSTAAV
jgi:hypothetical protein